VGAKWLLSEDRRRGESSLLASHMYEVDEGDCGIEGGRETSSIREIAVE